MTEAAADDATAAIRAAYSFDAPGVQLGVLEADGPVVDVPIRIPVAMFNRHGLVAGATGTGKTVTLQVMAEALSRAGVPVFAADIKGDLSGMARPAEPTEKLLARTQRQGQPWEPGALPCEFLSLGGQGVGVPVRATVSSFGPLLLSKVLGLNQVQESSLNLVFSYADSHGLLLLDLNDLSALLKFLVSDDGKAELKDIGGVSAATVGVILRSLVALADQGGDVFFGETEFDPAVLLRQAPDGRGIVSLLELPDLASRPALFSTFLMWLLADLFSSLPEVGDRETPRLVFFFDEAHLLFKDASKAFLDAITQTVRLIRSKGVGIFFVTQTPSDVPDEVLAQLGSRVQHQLRAHTPTQARALKAAVSTYPVSSYDLEQVLQQLGIGQAVVTVMDPDGAPTPVAWTRIWAPTSAMSPTDPGALRAGVAQSTLMAQFGPVVDRDSAYELLARRYEDAARARATTPPPAPAPSRPSPGPAPERRQAPAPRPRREPNLVEQVTGSSAFRQFMRTAAAELARGLFGTGRRR